MKSFFFLIVLLIFQTLPTPSTAQSYQIAPYGLPMDCKSASGERVAFYFTDSAMSSGGGYATYYNGQPVIYLSPSFLQKLPRLAGYFLIFHECAHHALPFGVGLGAPRTQETASDCFAAGQMVELGIVSNWSEFREAMTQLAAFPGSSQGHPPGPIRVANAARCSGLWATPHGHTPRSEHNSAFNQVMDSIPICETMDGLLEWDPVTMDAMLKASSLGNRYGHLAGMKCRKYVQNDHDIFRCEANVSDGVSDKELRSQVDHLEDHFAECTPDDYEASVVVSSNERRSVSFSSLGRYIFFDFGVDYVDRRFIFRVMNPH